jgi:glycosyltransferase involved in cell wall biosynthesis
MKVNLYPADQTGCGFYRMYEPGRIAELEGVQIEYQKGIPLEIGEMDDVEGKVLKTGAIDADVVVLQRPAKKSYVGHITELQRRGIAVVVELDDDLSCIHSQSPSFDGLNGRNDPEVHWRNGMRAAQMADLVVCTTDALAERFAQHGRVLVLPNCVPERLLDYPHESDGKTIGWSGAVHFHAGDLEITHGGVQLALDGTDWRFLKIGGGAEMVQQGLGLQERPDQTGPLTLGNFHPALGQLDIGIVPLAPSRFNAAKSYLKGIEYAAMGVPFVASPVPEYLQLSAEGLGLLAKDRGRNWKSALRSLMDEPALRQEISEQGRAIVRERYTYEVNGHRWVEAWSEAMGNREAAMQKGKVAA